MYDADDPGFCMVVYDARCDLVQFAVTAHLHADAAQRETAAGFVNVSGSMMSEGRRACDVDMQSTKQAEPIKVHV